jgi:hypothetical protein
MHKEMTKTYYLIDHTYTVDEANLFATGGHLLAFNPGPRDADLKVTIYYDDREPDSLSFVARAGRTFETNYRSWPLLKPDVRFALQVGSSEPVVCQATTGWNNARSDFSPAAKTKSPFGVRECAKSYMALHQLSRDWYVADGIVIDMPDKIWVRESEWAILLNPGDRDARLALRLHYDEEMAEHTLELPARRVRRVYMDDIARRNKHYGVHFHSDQPIAAQWLRTVNWYERAELMAFWSVPCVPGPLG